MSKETSTGGGYCQVITVPLKEGVMDEFIKTYKNEVLPIMTKQKGYKNIFPTCNRKENKICIVYIWESKELFEEANKSFPKDKTAPFFEEKNVGWSEWEVYH